MQYFRGVLIVFALIGCGGGDDGPATDIDAAPPAIDAPPEVVVDAAPDAFFQPGHRVFVSSVTFGSDLGGLTGADAKCQVLATAAGLPGGAAYKALVSDPTGSVFNRITITQQVYTVTLGLVANDSAEFFGGTALVAVDVDERGLAPASTAAWVGSSQRSCGSWTGTTNPNGSATATTSDVTSLTTWLYGNDTASCDQMRSLLCISQ